MSGVRFDAREFNATMGALQSNLPGALRNAGMAAALIISKHAIKTKLIAANPPFLNRQTGTLVRSVSASPRSVLAGDRVVASFGSNLDYARKHEIGGRFDEWIKGHKVKGYRRRAHMRRDDRAGRLVSVREVWVKEHWVRAHSVVRIYARRRMFGTALEEKRAIVPALAATALRLLAETKKTPAAGAIASAIAGGAA